MCISEITITPEKILVDTPPPLKMDTHCISTTILISFLSEDFWYMGAKKNSFGDFLIGTNRIIPYHRNVIRHFVNIEFFHKQDAKQEDCLGWVTIMEFAEDNLRRVLKADGLDLEQRKEIAKGVLNGFNHLWENCGIYHFDRKLENILLVDGIPKIIDYGLVMDKSSSSCCRKMGYTRRGSKYTASQSLGKTLN